MDLNKPLVLDLSRAAICLEEDCQAVFIPVGCNPKCPKCASGAFVPLAAWIGPMGILKRESEEEGCRARD